MPKGIRKNGAEKMREYRKRMRGDQVKYQEYLRKEKESLNVSVYVSNREKIMAEKTEKGKVVGQKTARWRPSAGLARLIRQQSTGLQTRQ